MSSVGENIKRIRTEKGMSQEQLAELLGVSGKTVSSWEVNRTEPKIGMIEQICTVFKCKKTDIIEPFVIDLSPMIDRINEDIENSLKDAGYYIDDDAIEVAQEIFENKELKLLFDAARDASAEDLKTVHQMLLALKRKENNNE